MLKQILCSLLRKYVIYMPDLIIAGVLVFHRSPWLSIITVSHFKHGHKLHHPKVLGPLSDDAREAFCLLQIDLVKDQRKQLHQKTFFFKQQRHFSCNVCLTWIHSERLLCAGAQAFVFPCLSSRANWGCHVKVSMPHVRKELEAESCPSEMSRDFIPRGSEQPAVFELTVNPKQTEGRREEKTKRGKEKEQGEMNTPREKRTFAHHAFEGNQKYWEQFGR